ncbi:Lipase [Aphelenchoides bicaudatus]|nr:Lipase [Aphelenchoides bicaudatus]
MNKVLAMLLMSLFDVLNAWTMPEARLTAPQLIRYWKYPVEVHNATTEDGYILEMHRIPRGVNGRFGKLKRPVVFIQHCLQCTSKHMIMNLPNQTLPFILADAGFDVWLGNMRGNLYSKYHVKYRPDSREYWNFTLDEMAKYDLSGQIDEVLRVTGQEKLHYVGHSQGTLTMFSKLSTDPEYGRKLKRFFALAPIGTIKHVQGFIGFLGRDLYPVMEGIYWLRPYSSFAPEFLEKLIEVAGPLICGANVVDEVCRNVMMLIVGKSSNQLNGTRMDVYLSDMPGGTSTKNIMHWGQLAKYGTLQRFDYMDKHKNLKQYGTAKPPKYDFSRIKTPIHLYWSSKDWLATEKDINEFILKDIPKQYTVTNNKLSNYNHIDFIWGLRAAKEIYYPMVQTMKEDERLSANKKQRHKKRQQIC